MDSFLKKFESYNSGALIINDIESKHFSRISLNFAHLKKSAMDISHKLSFDNTEIAFAHHSDQDLKKAEWLFQAMNNRWLVSFGARLAIWAIKLGLPVKGIIKRTVFEQFCGGETLQQTGVTAARLAESGINVILDYGVEAKEGESRYDHNLREFIRVIRYAATQMAIPFISIKITGFSRFGLLEKIHAGQPLTPEETTELDRVRDRIGAICLTAAENNIGVLVDAEESWIQQPVDDLTIEMMEKYNLGRVIVYNTIQLYRHDRLDYLKQFLSQADQKGYWPGLKLVRGAYMAKERKRANTLHYPSPIQPDKTSTDRDYNEALVCCLERLVKLSVFVATHNEESCMLAVNWMEEKKIPLDHPQVHFSQLYGMSDHISYNLARAGCQVSKYLPYGPLKEVMPYLIRRAQENTSIEGQSSRELGLIRAEIRRRSQLV